jgi:cyclopropane fatty-acyl-phospholipid synthase-like methyltransferase
LTQGQEWWHRFFQGAWAGIHSDVPSPEGTIREAETIERLLGLEARATLLDVPCGDGRLSVELATRGYGLTGVDITREFLEKARRAASERAVEIVLEEWDMRDLPWRDEFDGAFCYWGSFGYFDDHGNAEFLRAVAAALKPGGGFLLETHVMETLLPRYEQRGWRRYGETYVLEDRRLDHAGGRIETTWTFLGSGEPSDEHSSIRIYTYRALAKLLEDCGFSRIEGFDTLSEEPFEIGARRLLLRART